MNPATTKQAIINSGGTGPGDGVSFICANKEVSQPFLAKQLCRLLHLHNNRGDAFDRRNGERGDGRRLPRYGACRSLLDEVRSKKVKGSL